MFRFFLRRFDRVTVGSGFYQGYGGCVLDRRCILWYALNVGGRTVFIPRWHLRFLGYKRPEFHEKIRARMIDNDRKRQQGVS